MAILDFYPSYLTYKIINNLSAIVIYGRAVDGRQVMVVDRNYLPYFYVIPKEGIDIASLMSDLEHISLSTLEHEFRVVRVEITEKILQNPVKVIKVLVNMPKAVYPITREIYSHKDVEQVLEADINYTKRYFIDKNIVPLTICRAEGELGSLRTRAQVVFFADKIEQIDDAVMSPKVLAISIPGKGEEPDLSEPITLACLYSKGFQKILTWKKFKTNRTDIEFVSSEATLIERLFEVIEHFRPDFIIGFNSNSYDFPYLIARARKYSIPIDFTLDYSNVFLSKSYLPKVYMVGIHHIDLKLFARNFLGVELESIKAMPDSSVFLTRFNSYFLPLREFGTVVEDKTEEFSEYCIEILKKTKMIFDKFQHWNLFIAELSKISGLMPTYAACLKVAELFEWYMIGYYKYNNFLVPPKPTSSIITKRRKVNLPDKIVIRSGIYKEGVVCNLASVNSALIIRDYNGSVIATALDSLASRKHRIDDLLQTNSDLTLQIRSRILGYLLSYNMFGDALSRWYDEVKAASIAAEFEDWCVRFISSLNSAFELKVRAVYEAERFIVIEGEREALCELINQMYPFLVNEYREFIAAFVSEPHVIVLKDQQVNYYLNYHFKKFIEKFPEVVQEFFAEVLKAVFEKEPDKRVVKRVCHLLDKMNQGKIPDSKFQFRHKLTSRYNKLYLDNLNIKLDGLLDLSGTPDTILRDENGRPDYNLYYQKLIGPLLWPVFRVLGLDKLLCGELGMQQTLNKFMRTE